MWILQNTSCQLGIDSDCSLIHTVYNSWMQLAEYGYTWTFSNFDILGDEV